MKSFFTSTSQVINGFQQELMKVAYSATKAEEIMNKFMNNEFIEIKERLEKLEVKTGSHDIALQDIFNQ